MKTAAKQGPPAQRAFFKEPGGTVRKWMSEKLAQELVPKVVSQTADSTDDSSDIEMIDAPGEATGSSGTGQASDPICVTE